MCATELVRREVAGAGTPKVEVIESSTQQEATVEAQGIACPSCNTMNEAGWSFCQQCGGRLPQPAAPASDWKTNVDFTTTPTERAEVVSDTDVAANQPGDAGGVAPTVVVEQQPKSPPTRPSEVAAEQQPAPATPMTEVVQSAESSGLCSQCGQTSSLGSVFCAHCGAPMTVPRTVVMSSPYAPVKGRLHLVMEGGQLGDVYELHDQTIIGRTAGDICFPHDGFMSGKHAKIVQRGNTFVLTDEASRNGTFVKIKSEVELKTGDMILVGKQLFRFEV